MEMATVHFHGRRRRVGLLAESQDVNYLEDAGGINDKEDDVPDAVTVASGFPEGDTLPYCRPDKEWRQPEPHTRGKRVHITYYLILSSAIARVIAIMLS